MSFSVRGEMVFNSVSTIVRKKGLLLICNFTTTKLLTHGAWVDYICVVEFKLSLRYLIDIEAD